MECARNEDRGTSASRASPSRADFFSSNQREELLPPMSSATVMQERSAQFRDAYARIQNEIGKVIVGHTEIVHGVLTCLFVGGHALLEGVPGLGKRPVVRTRSQGLDLQVNRGQVTPARTPTDIVGTNSSRESPDGRRRS